MKIAVSSIGQNKENQLDKRFGRCEYFQICDLEKDEYKALSNDGMTSSGGAGIAAASQLIDENIDVIITGSLGPNAFGLIEKAGIKAYSCDTIPVFRAIEMLKQNQLSQISGAGRAHRGMR